MKKFNEKLLKLVSDNPDYELMFLVSENVCEFHWNVCDIDHIVVDSFALYDDEKWLDEEDYEYELYESLSDKYENEDELNEAVDDIMKTVEFKNYICVYLS